MTGRGLYPGPPWFLGLVGCRYDFLRYWPWKKTLAPPLEACAPSDTGMRRPPTRTLAP